MEGTAPEQDTSKMVRIRIGVSLKREGRKNGGTLNPISHIQSEDASMSILLHFAPEQCVGGTIFIPPWDGYCSRDALPG
jgi:hypothetical protein